MPVAIEAEQSVLGSILISPESFDKIASLITADDFYLEEHQSIFETMKELYKQNREIDPVTLVDALARDGVYDKAGGAQYVRLIAKTVPTAANIVDYAKIVKDKSTLRSLIQACEEISGEAYTEVGEVEHMLDAAEQRIFEIAERRESKNFEKNQRYPYARLSKSGTHLQGQKRAQRNADRLFRTGPHACGARRQRPCADRRAARHGQNLVCAQYCGKRGQDFQKSGLYLFSGNVLRPSSSPAFYPAKLWSNPTPCAAATSPRRTGPASRTPHRKWPNATS